MASKNSSNPLAKLSYKALQNEAMSLMLPANLKYKPLLAIIIARKNGQENIVEQILADVQQERQQRRMNTENGPPPSKRSRRIFDELCTLFNEPNTSTNFTSYIEPLAETLCDIEWNDIVPNSDTEGDAALLSDASSLSDIYADNSLNKERMQIDLTNYGGKPLPELESNIYTGSVDNVNKGKPVCVYQNTIELVSSHVEPNRLNEFSDVQYVSGPTTMTAQSHINNSISMLYTFPSNKTMLEPFYTLDKTGNSQSNIKASTFVSWCYGTISTPKITPSIFSNYSH